MNFNGIESIVKLSALYQARSRLQWSRPFNDCSEMKELFRNIGYNLEVHQITNGRLFGWFDIVQAGAALHVCISSNQALIFIGNASKNYLNFSIEKGQIGEYTKCQGIDLKKHSIFGFCTKTDEHFFAVSPGSRIHHLCVPKTLVIDMVNNLYGIQGIVFMEQNHTCQLSKESHYELRSLMDEARFMPSDKIHTKLFVKILDAIFQRDVKVRETVASSDLVKQFIRDATKFGGPKPLTVADIAAQLFTSKTTLSDHLKQLTGVSPSAFLEMAYLEQARGALMNPSDRRNVRQIAKDFGLGTRFSAKYLKKYGESPSVTKVRCQPIQLVALGLHAHLNP